MRAFRSSGRARDGGKAAFTKEAFLASKAALRPLGLLPLIPFPVLARPTGATKITSKVTRQMQKEINVQNLGNILVCLVGCKYHG